MDSTYNNIIESKTIDLIHRIIISKALYNHDTITTIAKELNFPRQSIHKEIKRGTITIRNIDLTEKTSDEYYATQYNHIQALSNRGRLSKIDDDKRLISKYMSIIQN